jgi:hypothetical protein
VRRLAPAGLAASVLLSGCLGYPAAPRPATPRPTTAIVTAQRTHEYPAGTRVAQHAGGGADSPAAAVRSFAAAYINWTAQSVSADMRALAERCVGQARSAMQLAAAQTAADYELKRGGIANRGDVEAVAPLSGRPGRYVVVTRELTIATATTAYQGLAPAWHVSIATVVEQAPGVWVLSGWQPQS